MDAATADMKTADVENIVHRLKALSMSSTVNDDVEIAKLELLEGALAMHDLPCASVERRCVTFGRAAETNKVAKVKVPSALGEEGVLARDFMFLVNRIVCHITDDKDGGHARRHLIVGQALDDEWWFTYDVTHPDASENGKWIFKRSVALVEDLHELVTSGLDERWYTSIV